MVLKGICNRSCSSKYQLFVSISLIFKSSGENLDSLYAHTLVKRELGFLDSTTTAKGILDCKGPRMGKSVVKYCLVDDKGVCTPELTATVATLRKTRCTECQVMGSHQ